MHNKNLKLSSKEKFVSIFHLLVISVSFQTNHE